MDVAVMILVQDREERKDAHATAYKRDAFCLLWNDKTVAEREDALQDIPLFFAG